MNGWIVLWTMKTSDGVKDHYQDSNIIFIEYDEAERSPEEQASQLYGELITGQSDNDYQELYSANLCEIKESSEAHYTNIDN